MQSQINISLLHKRYLSKEALGSYPMLPPQCDQPVAGRERSLLPPRHTSKPPQILAGKHCRGHDARQVYCIAWCM